MSTGTRRRPQAGHGVPNEAAFGVSQVIVAGGLAHVAGQIARTPDGRPAPAPDFQRHVAHAAGNLDAILARVGLARDDVVWVEGHVVGAPEALMALDPAPFDPARVAGVVVPIDGLYDPAYRVELTTIAVTEELRMHRVALPGPPGSPFARAVRAGPHLFVSGHDGLRDGEPPGPVDAQFALALDRVLEAVTALGGTADDVVSTHIHTVGSPGAKELAGIAEAHRQRFTGANRPTANLIGVHRLAAGALVQVSAAAVLDDP